MRIEILTNKPKLSKGEEFVQRLSTKHKMETAHCAYTIIEISFQNAKYITKWKAVEVMMQQKKRCEVNVIDRSGKHFSFVIIDDAKSKRELQIQKDYPGAGDLPQYAIDTILKKNYHHN